MKVVPLEVEEEVDTDVVDIEVVEALEEEVEVADVVAVHSQKVVMHLLDKSRDNSSSHSSQSLMHKTSTKPISIYMSTAMTLCIIV